MITTKQISSVQWQSYFDRFTKKHLRYGQPESARIELLGENIGDQVETEAARLLGISYDAKSKAFEVVVQNVDHLVYRPKEVWVVEEDDGFLSSIEFVSDDGTKELLTIRRSGPPATSS
jgi:hypothetical protein